MSTGVSAGSGYVTLVTDGSTRALSASECSSIQTTITSSDKDSLIEISF